MLQLQLYACLILAPDIRVVATVRKSSWVFLKCDWIKHTSAWASATTGAEISQECSWDCDIFLSVKNWDVPQFARLHFQPDLQKEQANTKYYRFNYKTIYLLWLYFSSNFSEDYIRRGAECSRTDGTDLSVLRELRKQWEKLRRLRSWIMDNVEFIIFYPNALHFFARLPQCIYARFAMHFQIAYASRNWARFASE